MPTPRSRRHTLVKYLREEKVHLDAINGVLREAARELEREILAASGGSYSAIVTRAQARAQLAAIEALLEGNWRTIQDMISTGQRAASVAASEVVSDYEELLFKGHFSEVEIATLRSAEANRAASLVETLDARIRSSRKGLSDQVWDTSRLANKSLDTLINVQLAKGANWQQLAKAVAGSVNPNTPGGVSYAAKRLARTEINNAFHASSIRRYQESEFTDKVDWNLSASHPEGDRCDTLAANSPYDKFRVPEKPHPMCFCFITPKLVSEDDFIRNLLSGKYGNPDTPTGVFFQDLG